MENILKAREKTLEIINNKTKNMDFFAENKIIYVLQANIFKNKIETALSKWIEVAQKSRNPNNTKEDFLKFKNDKIMAQVIKRLEKMSLVTEDKKVADFLEQYEGSWLIESELRNREVTKITKRAEKAEVKALQAETKAEQAEAKAEKAEQEKAKAEQEKAKAEQEKAKAEQEKAKAEQEKAKAEQEKAEQLSKAVTAFLALGKDIPYIADIMGASEDAVEAVIKKNNVVGK